MTDCAVLERDKPCVWFRHHTDACQDDTCTGCMPNMATRGHWCERHWEKILNRINSLPEHHQRLEEFLPSGDTEFAGQGFVTGTTEIRSVLNQAVADQRKTVRSRGAYWVTIHAETTFSRLPASHRYMYAQTPHRYTGPVPTNPRPKATYSWLATHLEAISQEQYAADFAADILTVSSRAYGLLYLTSKSSRRVGDCPAENCRNKAGEPGDILVDIDHSKTIPLQDVATCNNCGQKWDADDWRHLAKLMGKQEAAWLTPQVVASEHNLALATVYNYASRHQWRRRESKKRPGLIAYWHEDVTATLHVQRQEAA